MPNFDTQIHIVGEPENGIVITIFNPFKVFTIGWASITRYNAQLEDPEDVMVTYRNLCRALVALVLDLSRGQTTTLGDAHEPALIDIFDKGVRVNNSDLCLSAMIDTALHEHSMGGATAPRRRGYQMLHNLIVAIQDPATPVPHEIEPVEDDDYHPHDGDGDGHDHDH